MNRPKWQDCLTKSKYYVKDEYIFQLEKYCDELESKLELSIGTNTMLEKEIESLEEIIKEMEEEKINQAEQEFEEMYGEDW